MALKYQALNGMVINNTINIAGSDITKPGTPLVLTGIKCENGEFLNCFGNGYNTYASSSSIAVSAGTVSVKYGTTKVSFNGIDYYGMPGSRFYFYNYRSSSTQFPVNGVFKAILVSEGGIREVSFNINQTFSSSTSDTSYIYVAIQKTSEEIIVSAWFEPTTTQ